MNKFKLILSGLVIMLFLSCSSKQVGLKENWIDERDVIALTRSSSIDEWMEKAGRPTLVEISGDTSMYYYNYRPTMYAVAAYDSTSFFATWGKSSGEHKPSLANATEVWGNRKNIMQIKIVKNSVVSATITDGPDKKVFVRDLNGNIVLDQYSGYSPNISDEQRIDEDSYKEFKNVYNSVPSKDTVSAKEKSVNLPPRSPWEDYKYRQQKSEERTEASTAEATSATNKPAEIVPAAPNEFPAEIIPAAPSEPSTGN